MLGVDDGVLREGFGVGILDSDLGWGGSTKSIISLWYSAGTAMVQPWDIDAWGEPEALAAIAKHIKPDYGGIGVGPVQPLRIRRSWQPNLCAFAGVGIFTKSAIFT